MISWDAIKLPPINLYNAPHINERNEEAMKTIEGKSGIKATVICHSISEEGVQLVTWELEYPRIIHAELMTHRMFSRNAASSRAIPFAKMVEQLHSKPVRFGANVAGMQDSGEHEGGIKHPKYSGEFTPYGAWYYAKDEAVAWSKAFADAGYHKQVFNRLTEPFQMMKTVVSATEFANFFWLRNDGAADPTLAELARCMLEALESSKPKTLKAGEYHLPYVDYNMWSGGMRYFESGDDSARQLSYHEAIKVSAARCAAVSYRNEDYTLEKCLQVYDRLVGADRKHASAFEHQATPMQGFTGWKNKTDFVPVFNCPNSPVTWQDGVSHTDRNGQLWSGNFKGFIQYRKLIKGENYND